MHTLTALADPNRRRIVEMLGRGEQASGEIAAEFAVSPAAISQHLKVLREARLVRVRVEAQRRIYSLDPGGARRDRRLAAIGEAILERPARCLGARAAPAASRDKRKKRSKR